MKFLLTTHQFFPEFAAGTEVLTRGVARELIARGHQVRVLTARPSSAALPEAQRCDEYEFEGIHVYRFHHAYTPMAGQTANITLGYDNRLAARYFASIVQQYQPDLVHFFHLNRLGTGLIEHATSIGLPAYMTPTDFWPICPTAQLMLPNGQPCTGPSPHAGNCVKHFARAAQATSGSVLSTIAPWVPTAVADTLVRWTRAGVLPPYPHHHEVQAIGARLPTNVARLNQLRRIMVPNRAMHEVLLRHGVQPEKVVECSFGVEDAPAPIGRPQRPSDQPLRLGYIGTLAPHKGVHILIDAFKTLPAERTTLQIYGDPKELPDYAAKLQQLAAGHPGISFCGVFPNAAIAQVLAELDALVVPSLWLENTPLVLHSAQAARCPVVASDFSGISALIEHEANGLLFEAGNASALAAQLGRLLAEPPLAQRLGAQARPPKSTAQYVDELLQHWSAG